MIKMEELRKGNWIFDPDRKILDGNGNRQVESLAEEWCHHTYMYKGGDDGRDHSGNKYENIQPIELTSEILNKIKHFGPYEKKGTKGWFNGDNIVIREADMSLFLHSEVNGDMFWCAYLRSLHHLQNLYYDIEHHELDIEL